MINNDSSTSVSVNGQDVSAGASITVTDAADEPTQQEPSDNAGTVSGSDKVPETGDDFNIAVWAAIMGLAAAVAAGTAVYSRRRKSS